MPPVDFMNNSLTDCPSLRTFNASGDYGLITEIDLSQPTARFIRPEVYPQSSKK